MRTTVFFAISFMMFLFFSCKKDEKTSIGKINKLNISYGTSFGMCAGYCKCEMQIDSSKVIFTFSSWTSSTHPQKQCQKSISKEKWGNLISMVDSGTFNKLDSVYGCPDCADGGAEWVEVNTTTWHHRVKMDYSGPNRPVVIKALMDSLRALRAGLNNCD
jgi:hypothetical protein